MGAKCPHPLAKWRNANSPSNGSVCQCSQWHSLFLVPTQTTQHQLYYLCCALLLAHELWMLQCLGAQSKKCSECQKLFRLWSCPILSECLSLFPLSYTGRKPQARIHTECHCPQGSLQLPATETDFFLLKGNPNETEESEKYLSTPT